MFKLKKKTLIATLAIIFVLGFTLFLRAIYVTPILMYHSVNPQRNYIMRKLIVWPASFERQMRFLKEKHYNVVTLEKLAELIKSKKRIPFKTVAITLDDGYRDNYTYAYPILKKYGLPATMFVIINEIGRPEGDRLSWEEIKEMHSSGLITIGSHALGPEPLINIKSEGLLRSEIFDSKRILEEKLGLPVNCFSYPEGMFNAHIKKLVQEAGYRVAVTTNPGKYYSSRDVFALKRLRISSSSDSLFVFCVESSGYYNFMREHRHK